MTLLSLCHKLAGIMFGSDQPSPRLRLVLGEHAPYCSRSLPNSGTIPHIISSILCRKNVSVDYTWTNWKRAYEGLQTGKFQGSLRQSHKLQSDDRFFVSEPILHSELVFFYLKKTSFTWKELGDLAGIRSGGTLTSNYPEDYLQAAQNGHIKIDWLSDDTLNFKRLLQGKIDVYPVSKEIGLFKLKNCFTPKERARLTWSKVPLTRTPVHLVLSKKHAINEKLIALFNDGLKKQSLC